MSKHGFRPPGLWSFVTAVVGNEASKSRIFHLPQFLYFRIGDYECTWTAWQVVIDQYWLTVLIILKVKSGNELAHAPCLPLLPPTCLEGWSIGPCKAFSIAQYVLTQVSSL